MPPKRSKRPAFAGPAPMPQVPLRGLPSRGRDPLARVKRTAIAAKDKLGEIEASHLAAGLGGASAAVAISVVAVKKGWATPTETAVATGLAGVGIAYYGYREDQPHVFAAGVGLAGGAAVVGGMNWAIEHEHKRAEKNAQTDTTRNARLADAEERAALSDARARELQEQLAAAQQQILPELDLDTVQIAA